MVGAWGLEKLLEVVFLRSRGLPAALLVVGHRHEVEAMALLTLLLPWSRGRSVITDFRLLLLPFSPPPQPPPPHHLRLYWVRSCDSLFSFSYVSLD